MLKFNNNQKMELIDLASEVSIMVSRFSSCASTEWQHLPCMQFITELSLFLSLFFSTLYNFTINYYLHYNRVILVFSALNCFVWFLFMHAEMLNIQRTSAYNDRLAQPYCQCWNRITPFITWNDPGECSCGEYDAVNEWKWEPPRQRADTSNGWVIFSPDHKQVTFHPFYSSGTAAVKGDTPLLHNHHYYWEVKMLTDPYGTAIMVGVGTDKADISDSFNFVSLLGKDAESYGLSYTGTVQHNAQVTKDSTGFCKGTIVGVMVDLWQGTLEFYLNRQSQGLVFYNLRRHKLLFPMMCSTAAQSSMRLIYTASWKASLLVDAAKALAASVTCSHEKIWLPPGLRHKLRAQFWLTLPNKDCLLGDAAEEKRKKRPTQSEFKANALMNGFYVDNVERHYRIVVWQ